MLVGLIWEMPSNNDENAGDDDDCWPVVVKQYKKAFRKYYEVVENRNIYDVEVEDAVWDTVVAELNSALIDVVRYMRCTPEVESDKIGMNLDALKAAAEVYDPWFEKIAQGISCSMGIWPDYAWNAKKCQPMLIDDRTTVPAEATVAIESNPQGDLF